MSSDSDSDILQDFPPPKSSVPSKNKKLNSLSKKDLNPIFSSEHLNKRKLNKIKEENSNFVNSQASIHADEKANTRSLLYDPKLVS